MYDMVLTTHNIFRWIVLFAGLAAAGKALFGWLTKKEWDDLDAKLGLIYTISFDIQLLLGLALYIFFRPIVKTAFQDFGAAMSDKDLRFFAVEHLSMMVLALILAHVGRALSKRDGRSASRYKKAAIFFTLSILIVLVAMPWWRPLL